MLVAPPVGKPASQFRVHNSSYFRASRTNALCGCPIFYCCDTDGIFAEGQSAEPFDYAASPMLCLAQTTDLIQPKVDGAKRDGCAFVIRKSSSGLTVKAVDCPTFAHGWSRAFVAFGLKACLPPCFEPFLVRPIVEPFFCPKGQLVVRAKRPDAIGGYRERARRKAFTGHSLR
jgi:hypothetical protein